MDANLLDLACYLKGAPEEELERLMDQSSPMLFDYFHGDEYLLKAKEEGKPGKFSLGPVPSERRYKPEHRAMHNVLGFEPQSLLFAPQYPITGAGGEFFLRVKELFVPPFYVTLSPGAGPEIVIAAADHKGNYDFKELEVLVSSRKN